MKKNLTIVFFSVIICFQCLSQKSLKNPAVPATPVLFTGVPINSAMNERDLAISPDGTELFYTIVVQATQFHTILHCKKDKAGKWSSPEVASFSGRFSDMEPAFTEDGQKLFFSSNRPGDSSEAKNYDIWFVEKLRGEWINPKNVGAPVNTAADEFFPSVASNGNLYFTAAYQKGVGKEDIYVATWKNGKYTESVALDTGVNSALYEFNAYVSPDERFILFTSFGRKDDRGRGNLYLSRKDDNGTWLPAKNLQIINSDKLDYCPFVSFDKKTLFFTSERHGIPESFINKRTTYDELKRLANLVQNGTGNIYELSWDAVVQSIH